MGHNNILTNFTFVEFKKMSLGHVKNRIKTLNNLNLDEPTGELGRLKLVEMKFADCF